MGLQPAPNDAERKRAIDVMGRIGSDLLRESKACQEDSKLSSSRKDILSLLIRANTMQDLPEAHRLNDEVMARAYKLIVD